jgi:hypothetical protein
MDSTGVNTLLSGLRMERIVEALGQMNASATAVTLAINDMKQSASFWMAVSTVTELVGDEQLKVPGTFGLGLIVGAILGAEQQQAEDLKLMCGEEPL